MVIAKELSTVSTGQYFRFYSMYNCYSMYNFKIFFILIRHAKFSYITLTYIILTLYLHSIKIFIDIYIVLKLVS